MAIEQPYTLEVAAELIPMINVQALRLFLSKHKDMFPGRYKTIGGQHIARGGYEVRILFESEILKIRDMVLHDLSHSRFAKAGRPVGSGKNKIKPDSPLAGILRRAYA